MAHTALDMATSTPLQGLQKRQSGNCTELIIQKNAAPKEPIEITFSDPLSVLRIIVEEGADVEIIETLSGKKIDHTVELTIADNSHVDFVSLQNTDPDAEVKIQQKSTLGENASVHWHNATLGGSTVSHDLISHVRGEKSESTIDWIFYGKAQEKQSLSARNIFDAAEGFGEINVQGVAEGKAHTLFDGLIEITKNGRGTNTYLTEKTLMLDKTAKVDAVPGLEIKTNDVKASHSATVTKVSEEDIFYFATRGITESLARKMYINGFLGNLVQNIPHQDSQLLLRELIARKYDKCL